MMRFFLGGSEMTMHTNTVNRTSSIKSKKSAYTKMHASQLSCHDLLEYLPCAIVIFYMHRVIYANQAATLLLRAETANQLYNKEISDFVFPDRLPEANRRIAAIESGSYRNPWRQEKIILLDGESIVVNLSSIPYTIDHKKSVMVFIDTTSLRYEHISELQNKVQALEKKEKRSTTLIDQLIGILHELRTPLNVIFSSLQLLEIIGKECNSQDNRTRTQKYLSYIRQNCLRLLRLIDNFISFSKINSEFSQLDLQQIDIIALVESIALSVTEYANQNSISINFTSSVSENVISFDPDKMERIILNLLSNAIKYNIRDGRVDINVASTSKEVIISIKDSGIGMHESLLQSIFTRFTQLHDSRKKDAVGSGIGLFLVKSLVEMHEGNITVNSKIGQGSEFVIAIPNNLHSKATPFPANLSSVNIDKKVDKINVAFSDVYNIKNRN
ncbi:MAG: hypothetical protein COA82_07330 [Alkaliphilus sp.]|nr:MAG: hypothetical protein COA82_07330 [Alkaliphilus sp.]